MLKATALAFAAKAQLKQGHNVAVNWIWGYGGILFTAGASEVAAALAGGLVAAGITIALGRSYLWIIESMQNGKLSRENFNTKTPGSYS